MQGNNKERHSGAAATQDQMDIAGSMAGSNINELKSK
jgi:hypothetical protein